MSEEETRKELYMNVLMLAHIAENFPEVFRKASIYAEKTFKNEYKKDTNRNGKTL